MAGVVAKPLAIQNRDSGYIISAFPLILLGKNCLLFPVHCMNGIEVSIA